MDSQVQDGGACSVGGGGYDPTTSSFSSLPDTPTSPSRSVNICPPLSTLTPPTSPPPFDTTRPSSFSLPPQETSRTDSCNLFSLSPLVAMSSTTGKVRAHELVSKNKADLTKQLVELKQELLSLRVQKVAGGSAAKLTKM